MARLSTLGAAGLHSSANSQGRKTITTSRIDGQDLSKILIADGACLPSNPGGALGTSVCDAYGEIIKARGIAPAPNNTNNQAEALAFIDALNLVPKGENSRGWLIQSDSEYVVKLLTEKRLEKWKAKGWRRKKGQVQNLELIKEIDRLCQERPHVKAEAVKAHSGYLPNEVGDTEAKRQAMMAIAKDKAS